VPSIVAGFLLTAIPNCTGRLAVTGGSLLALVAAWVAGRLAILASTRIGAPLAAPVDLLFVGCLAGVVAREILAGRNLRNARLFLTESHVDRGREACRSRQELAPRPLTPR
jgi:uncharacterized protein involved in response to NO